MKCHRPFAAHDCLGMRAGKFLSGQVTLHVLKAGVLYAGLCHREGELQDDRTEALVNESQGPGGWADHEHPARLADATVQLVTAARLDGFARSNRESRLEARDALSDLHDQLRPRKT